MLFFIRGATANGTYTHTWRRSYEEDTSGGTSESFINFICLGHECSEARIPEGNHCLRLPFSRSDSRYELEDFDLSDSSDFEDCGDFYDFHGFST